MADIPQFSYNNRFRALGTLVDASSFAPSFSPSRILDQLRSKVWRSRSGWNAKRDWNDLVEFTEAGVWRQARIIGTTPSSVANFSTPTAYANAVAAAMGAADIWPGSLAPSLWLDAESISAADGELLTLWSDISGAGRNFTQAGADAIKPIYRLNVANEYPAVYVDGLGRRMSSTATMADILGVGGSLGRGTIFVVFRPDSDASISGILFGQINSNRAAYFNNAATGFTARTFDGSVDEATKTPATRAVWHVGCWMYDGTNINAFLDDADTAAVSAAVSGAQTDLAQTLLLGSDGGSHFKGFITAIIAFPSALSEENRRRIQQTLVKKYNVTVDATTAPTWNNTYSVSYNSDLKFVVSRATGADAFALGFGTGHFLGRSAHRDLGFIDVDKSAATSYTADNPAFHSREWLRFDLGSAKQLTCGIVTNFNAGSGGTIRLICDTAYNAWISPDFSDTLLGNSQIRMATFDHTKRYWVLLIEDVQNPSAYSEVGVAFGGLYDRPRCFDYGAKKRRDELSSISFADQGAHYSNVKQTRRGWDLNFRFIDSWGLTAYETMGDYVKVGVNFFFSFSVLEDPTNTLYCFTPDGFTFDEHEDLSPIQYMLRLTLLEALG